MGSVGSDAMSTGSGRTCVDDDLKPHVVDLADHPSSVRERSVDCGDPRGVMLGVVDTFGVHTLYTLLQTPTKKKMGLVHARPGQMRP